MWIVRLALARPYTFVVMALLILIGGVLTIQRMAVDIFPNIPIPVVGIVWTYAGISPEEMNQRVVIPVERAITTTVSDVEHQESQSLKGIGLIKVFFQPGASPDAGVAQLTAITQTLLRVLPPGITPPLIIRYSASNVPIAQTSLSSETLGESDLFDAANAFIRPGLAVVPGASVLLPNGGKPKQVMVDLDPQKLAGKGLSANDVVNALTTQNLTVPAGSAKIGNREYDVKLNSSPEAIATLNDLPIQTKNGVTTYIRDVAFVHEGAAVQTNIVRQNGRRTAIIPILKSGAASTLAIIDNIKKTLPNIQANAPPALNIKLLFDQSFFVRASIKGVIIEASIAAALTALMILLFLGSWRSTLIIAVSIPLSILVSIIVMNILGQTLNIMTLGGLSLAVGILVDDATVEIENIHRNMGQKKGLKRSILDGAQQIATPALVATLAICIVFVPVFFLGGVASAIFAPLATAVIFAMLASYILSRTLVPTLVMYLLRKELPIYHAQEEEDVPSAHFRNGRAVTQIERDLARLHHQQFEKEHPSGTPEEEAETPITDAERRASEGIKQSWVWRIHEGFEHGFEKFRASYTSALDWALAHRPMVITAFVVLFVGSLGLYPFIGQNFFPTVDAGQLRLHVRVPTGTRVEETELRFRQVEGVIRQVIPARELDLVLANIGLPVVPINLLLSDNPTIGAGDGEILVSMKEDHGPTAAYIERLRHEIHRQFPDLIIFFQPADIVNQTLNFGLPAPIDIQVTGRDKAANQRIAGELKKKISKVQGVVDAFIYQAFDQPQLRLDIDRVRAQQAGLAQRDIANNVLVNLSSSTQTNPNQWLNTQTGVNYTVAVQTPPSQLGSINELGNITVTGPGQPVPQLLTNFAQLRRTETTAVASDYNIQRTVDLYSSVSGRDLGGVSKDVRRIIAEAEKHLPKGTTIVLRGQAESMRTSFIGLGLGVAGAILLVYLLMAVNFQSWLDPLIIITALPGALAGILWMLFVTQTTLSVPALMGAIMCIGVATANSILLVTFANERREEEPDLSPRDAALDAGFTRLRPVLMTALAMIIGLLPMSLGMGEGGEQNAPLGRAVIGGLMLATVTTLFFVPIMFSYLKKKEEAPAEAEPQAQAA
ncbi:efflux RND transporter permease subunit [Hymenobacter ginsengisoli]|uniref:Efflux RND transporter permease subunit n=1 Tax=Hymenobacter ginsengisoli TaxID=1051626 RepID=A0ABP8QKA3_9BACT|nr:MULTISPECIES: efflux RND transporter permease subunit [unclassified Hymenobacter]MBO2033322.1 efflux RND transporter permease subunit [Hymenobacter sp. BT559]